MHIATMGLLFNVTVVTSGPYKVRHWFCAFSPNLCFCDNKLICIRTWFPDIYSCQSGLVATGKNLVRHWREIRGDGMQKGVS